MELDQLDLAELKMGGKEAGWESHNRIQESDGMRLYLMWPPGQRSGLGWVVQMVFCSSLLRRVWSPANAGCCQLGHERGTHF